MRWLAILTLLCAACGGFPRNLARTHELVKEMSAEVEPRIKGLCVAKAVACEQNGVTRAADCGPLVACRAWAARYAEGARLTHRGLAHLNGVWVDLKKAGVVK